MNKLLESIFKNSKPNFDKLQAYGFEKSADGYKHSATIMDGQFSLNITIDNGDINTEVIDLSANEPYTLFLADNAVGSFVGAVRTAYENVMRHIADNCFDKSVFKANYTQLITKYVFDKYGDSLEFLWEKFSDNAIWRRKDNKKWYGIVLTVVKSKLGLPSDTIEKMLDISYELARKP